MEQENMEMRDKWHQYAQNKGAAGVHSFLLNINQYVCGKKSFQRKPSKAPCLKDMEYSN